MIKRTFNLDELFIIDTGFYGWCLDIIGEMIPSVLTNNSLQDNFKNYMLKPLWRKYQFVNANYSDTEKGQQQFKNDFANQLQDVCVEFYTYVKANVKHFEGLDNKTDLIKQVSSVVAPINDIIDQTATDTALAKGTTAQNIGTTLYNDSVWLSMFNTYMTPQRKGEMLNRFAWLFIVAYYVSEDENAEEFTLEITEPLEMPTGDQVIEFDVDEGLRYAVVTIEKPYTLNSGNIKSGVNIGGVLGSYEGPDVSDATASSDDILLGKVAYGDNYQRLVGTIPTYDYEGGEDISGIVPVGAININENGEYDVTNYAQANVNVRGVNPLQYIIDNNGTTPSCAYLFYKWGGTDATPLFGGEGIANLDTSNATSAYEMFTYCSNLITAPQFDTGNVENMYNMFSACGQITTIPQYDTSNVKAMNRMFANCTELITIPQLNTSNVEDMSYMFYSCGDLTTIAQIDVSNVTNMNAMFYGCRSLKTLLMYGMKVNFDISASTKFETDDLVVILNNLATLSSTATLKMGSTNLAKLSDAQKQIAIDKGWTLA